MSRKTALDSLRIRGQQNAMLIAINNVLEPHGMSIARGTIKGKDFYKVVKAITVHYPDAAPSVEDWQPIATAPKEETIVVGLLSSGEVVRMWWSNDPPFTGWLEVKNACECEPTHWMPLPAPSRETGA